MKNKNVKKWVEHEVK